MLRSSQSAYFLIVVLAIASLGPLLYMHQGWLLQSRNFAEIILHLSLIREESAEAHLWAEELITGDTTEDVDEVEQHFVVARKEAARFEEDLALKISQIEQNVIDGHTILEHARILKEDLLLLELKANSRLADRAVSAAGSESDISFDAIYHRALDRTRMLEKNIRNEQAIVTAQNLQKHWITLFLWASTLVGTAIFLVFLRSRQVRAEDAKKQLESRFQEAQKLESLGVLAGGIAHDFNNLLQAISGNTSLLLYEETLPAGVRVQVEEIEAGAQKASDLTSQMLAYSGKGRLSSTVIPFDDLVAEIGSLVRLSTPKTVRVEYELGGGSACVSCNLTQLQQVVMNLVINAAEASVESCNTVTVRTCFSEFLAEDLASGFVGDEVLEAGSYIVFEVEDQGSGMSEETLKRCFEPFFSTKFTGRGLGLAAVLGIVRGHEGGLRVNSHLGLGTNFQVLFPVSKDKPTSLIEKPQLDRNDGAGRRVMVVDDDEMVLKILCRMLVRTGYEVYPFTESVDALDQLKNGCSKCKSGKCDKDLCLGQKSTYREFHAVVLDMEMPGRTGLEVGKEIRSRWPGLPLVLSSGYGHEVIQDGGPFDAFIQKPYNLSMLMETIGSVALPAESPSQL
ncbi:MAG: ATP-binding protein [Planctomycetota bacterium]